MKFTADSASSSSRGKWSSGWQGASFPTGLWSFPLPPTAITLAHGLLVLPCPCKAPHGLEALSWLFLLPGKFHTARSLTTFKAQLTCDYNKAHPHWPPNALPTPAFLIPITLLLVFPLLHYCLLTHYVINVAIVLLICCLSCTTRTWGRDFYLFCFRW